MPRRALVFGNNAYTHWRELEKGVRDAEDMAALLGARGYQVTTVLNGDAATMGLALEEFVAGLPSPCAAVVFFSGHGEVSAGVAYLVPVDGLCGSPDRGSNRATTVLRGCVCGCVRMCPCVAMRA